MRCCKVRQVRTKNQGLVKRSTVGRDPWYFPDINPRPHLWRMCGPVEEFERSVDLDTAWALISGSGVVLWKGKIQQWRESELDVKL